MESDGLFVDDLLETLSRVRAAPAAESPPDVSTQALGEEGDQADDAVVTTQALGEEGDQADDVVTTDALGEEGDQPEDGVVTTQALGEEGDQADDQPIESGWGSASAEQDLFLDEPADSYHDYDDFDPFDTAQ
jgi:hypothetical protein